MSLSNDPEQSEQRSRRRRDTLAERVMIRPLEPRDIPAIREIDRAAFTPDEQYEAEFYDSLLANTNVNAFAAEYDALTIGWILLDASVKPVRFRSLSVHPHYQRRGYGKRLLEHALARYPVMDLLVRRDNTAAIVLYEKCGFIATTPDPEMPHRLRMIH